MNLKVTRIETQNETVKSLWSRLNAMEIQNNQFMNNFDVAIYNDALERLNFISSNGDTEARGRVADVMQNILRLDDLLSKSNGITTIHGYVVGIVTGGI